MKISKKNTVCAPDDFFFDQLRAFKKITLISIEFDINIPEFFVNKTKNPNQKRRVSGII